MSRKTSHADFSAFDFNDSSDNSDIPPRGSYLSRASLGASNHNSNNSNNSVSSPSSSNGNDDDDDNEPDDNDNDNENDDNNNSNNIGLGNNNNNNNNNLNIGNLNGRLSGTSSSQHASDAASGGTHGGANSNDNDDNRSSSCTDGAVDDNNKENAAADVNASASNFLLGSLTAMGGGSNVIGSSNNHNHNHHSSTGKSIASHNIPMLDANNSNSASASAATNVTTSASAVAAAAAAVGLLSEAFGGGGGGIGGGGGGGAGSGGGNSNNCPDPVRSGSASLSNTSLSINHNSGIGGNLSSIIGNGGGGGGSNSGCGSISDRKKYRHQNYSKNIYIGTKNAEKWELTRARLQFKNDVEFVAYLLNLAENDTERPNNLPPPSASSTPTKSFSSNFKLEPNLSVKEFNNTPSENGDQPPQPPQPVRKKSKKRVQFSDALNGFPKMKDFTNFAAKAKKHDQKVKGRDGEAAATTSGAGGDTLPEVLDCRIAEKIKSELEEKSATKETPTNALCLKAGKRSIDNGDDEDEIVGTGTSGQASGGASGNVDSMDGTSNQAGNFRVRVKSKKKPLPAMNTFNNLNVGGNDDFDDGEMSDGDGTAGGSGAGGGGGDGDGDGDEDDEEMDEEAMAREMKNEQNFVEEEDEHDIAFRSNQSCRECSITHDYKVCPLRNAMANITDAVDLAEWIERKNLEALAKLKASAQRHAKQDHEDDEDLDETSQMSELETKPLITFAEASVPAEFELHNVEPNVTGVFVRSEVRGFTKLGPLIGQVTTSNDVREGADMKWIFEICEAGAEKSQLVCCDNPNTSNWLRYIRPAPTYEERNVNLVSIDRQAFFVTCRDVKNGMELLYWSDECNTMWRKKHTEKTNCGGCNLKFDHPLYYRTHCSIFHDPSMSLTIRKYHCKVCGEAVLGKDNIMKHAAEMHDGKGAYQCQFCNKFFLRLNYLEMHRTYGCAANPNRARPLCDFCGRKFCQPQKLKAHIKRMHSDMAEVLRDFQCKLCSKLLGSRAALQRHSKEVHSRNSTVVSCPRCQKLFQNRSNLKIHMLTHSGVRPFKCSETECSAAFTTKQCLQFHYKKVHNYTQEQMPKIERSVAYTFDAYSGGMKVDFLEQAPRRRRKSLEDQNSMLSSSIQSDADASDDNIFETIKKSGKSIKDLCRNEPNLSLLSTKISSIFGEKVTGSRKRKKRKEPPPSVMAAEEDDEDERLEEVRRKQNAQLSLVESFLTTTVAQRLTAQQQVQQVVAAAAAVSAMAGSVGDDSNKMHIIPALNQQHMSIGGSHGGSGMDNDDDEEDDDEDDDDGNQQQPDDEQTDGQTDNGYRQHPALNTLGQNLVASKGSKKWISDDDRLQQRDCGSVDQCGMGNDDVGGGAGAPALNPSSCSLNANGGAGDMGLPSFVPPSAVDDTSKLIGQNRDFLARLMSSASASHGHHHNATNREEDENSSFLDVVEGNNNGGGTNQMQQYHHNGNNAANGSGNAGTGGIVTGGGGGGGSVGGAGNVAANSQGETSQMQMNPLTHPQSFMSSFYNNANARLSGSGTSASTSASMLVEAALNSVGNMIDNENNDLKVPTESNNINTDSPMSSHVGSDSNRFSGSGATNACNSMDNLENELKMMKNLSNFPMQIPPLPMFPNSNASMNSCNMSPNTSTTANPQSNQNNHDVDVDAGSTPRSQHLGSGGNGDADAFSAAHHHTPPSPQPISPGRDYSMFGSNTAGSNATQGGPGTAGSSSSGNSVGGSSTNNNISASSPLPSLHSQRRTASSVGSTYPDHELISPASSPSIPRYNFNRDMMSHKHSERDNDRRHNVSGHSHLSSDEDSSIVPQTSSGQDMRMKFSQPQMDLMYSKYESMTNAASLKYNSHEIDSPSDFRGGNIGNPNVTATGPSSDMSDLQGLDMSSRSNLGSTNYHHNFQLPSSASSNLSGLGRYHHHIYDILSEREQHQQSQAQSQQQHHSVAAAAAVAAAQHQQQHHPTEHSSQLSMQQHQSAMHSMLSDQLNEPEHDQTTSVDLSRTANYVVSSPPQLPYNHPHHDMLRMASLDLTPNTNMSVGNNRSFLSTQMQHQSRESLEHHRLLSTVEQHRILAASNVAAADQHRLLVDPTAHLLMEQNNRLLGSDQSRLLGETAQNRHMAARGFGAYHQVASGNYHGVRPSVIPSANHHASNPSNYHPFPAYY